MDPREKREQEKKLGKKGERMCSRCFFSFWWNEGEAKEIVFHLQNKHVSHAEKEGKRFGSFATWGLRVGV